MIQNKKRVASQVIVKNLIKLTPWIIACFIPYCLNMGGIIKWKNQNTLEGHLSTLYDIITKALNEDEVFNGIKLVFAEFIFNFTSIGCWIKFIVFLAVPLVFLKIVIAMVPYFPAISRTVIITGKAIIDFICNAVRSAKNANILRIIECWLRYHIIPDRSGNHSLICISTIIGDLKFFGGVKTDSIKFPKLHLISDNGAENDRLLDYPVLIVQTSSGVFLCGSGLVDENGTTQRKIRLSHNSQAIRIGRHTYEIYIKEI